MSWSIPQALRMFKDHTLLFRARVGRKSAGRPPPSSSIEIFTETSISYQCHGVFPRPYGCLRTIPYYFELGSAERALAAPPPSSSIEIFTETSISYQCHGVFPRPYGCLRTIPYYFELGSAERALAAPHPLHRSKYSLRHRLATNVMEYSPGPTDV